MSKGRCFISAVGLILFFACRALPAASDPADGVVIAGMRIPCTGCRRLNEDECEVLYQEQPAVVSCQSALPLLLDVLVARPGKEVLPAAAELRNFLLGSGGKTPGLWPALRLFVLRSDGRPGAEQTAAELARRHPALIARLLSETAVPPQFLTALSAVFDRTPMTLDNAGIKAQLALHLRQPHTAFYEDLSVHDLSSDLALLDAWRRIFAAAGKAEAGELAYVQELLEKWRRAPYEAIAAQSPAAGYPGLTAAAAAYLERLQVQLVLSRIPAGSAEPLRVLDAVAKLPYERRRTPELHHEVVKQLLALRPADLPAGSVSVEIASMLTLFVRSDPEAAQAAARVGEAMMQENRRAQADAFLNSLGLPSAPQARKPLSWTAALIVVVAGAGAALFFRRRSRLVPGDGGAMSASERAELRLLRRYFGLKPEAGLAELARSYHSRAKGAHPDAGNADHGEFALLSSRYRRAQELMRLAVRPPSI